MKLDIDLLKSNKITVMFALLVVINVVLVLTYVVYVLRKAPSNIPNQALTKTYDEIRADNPDKAISPSMSGTNDKSALTTSLQHKGESYQVTYISHKFDPESLTIVQGDTVVFYNGSDSPISIMADDESWSSVDPINSKTGLAQRFDYLGTYKFFLQRDNTIRGEVVVVKP